MLGKLYARGFLVLVVAGLLGGYAATANGAKVPRNSGDALADGTGMHQGHQTRFLPPHREKRDPHQVFPRSIAGERHHQSPLNILDETSKQMKSAADKLKWVKENFRYLVMIAGAFLFLVFSLSVYRKCTRDNNDYDDDPGIKYVVVQSTDQGAPPPRPPPPQTTTAQPPPPPPPPRPPPPKATPKPQRKPKINRIDNKAKPGTQKTTKTEKKPSSNKPTRKKTAQNYVMIAMETENDDYYHDNVFNLANGTSDSAVFKETVSDTALTKKQQINEFLYKFFSQVWDAKKVEKPSSVPKQNVIGIVNEGIPMSCHTRMLQMHHSDIDMNGYASDPTRYLSEARTLANELYDQDRAFTGSTSKGPFPVFGEFRLNGCLSASLMERCWDYYPTASTRTNLPITATAS